MAAAKHERMSVSVLESDLPRALASLLTLVFGLARYAVILAVLVASAAAVGALSLAAQEWTLSAPTFAALDALTISKDAATDRSVVVGRDALGQRAVADSADLAHVAFQRDADGNWYASNVSTLRRLAVKAPEVADTKTPRLVRFVSRFFPSGPPSQFARRIALGEGDVVYLPGAEVTVERVDARSIDLVAERDGAGVEHVRMSWTLGGAMTVARASSADGAAGFTPYPACGRAPSPVISAIATGRSWLRSRRFFGWRHAGARTLVEFGGEATCAGRAGDPSRLAVADLPQGAVRVILTTNVLELAPGASGAAAVVRPDAPRDGDAIRSFESFSGARRLVARPDVPGVFFAGRTRYKASVNDSGDLVVVPETKIHRFREPETGDAAFDELPPPDCFSARRRRSDLDAPDCSIRGDAGAETVQNPAWAPAEDGCADEFDEGAAWCADWRVLNGPETDRTFEDVNMRVVEWAGVFAVLTAIFRVGLVKLTAGGAAAASRGSGATAFATSVFVGLAFGAAFTRYSYGDAIPIALEVNLLCVAWLAAGAAWMGAGLTAHRAVSWLLLTGLVFLGAAALLHMSVFADETTWLVYWSNRSWVMFGLAGGIAALRAMPITLLRSLWCRPQSRVWRVIRMGLVVPLIVAGFFFMNLLWFLFGDEGGLGIFQPSEFNKTIFIVFLSLFGVPFLVRLQLWTQIAQSARRRRLTFAGLKALAGHMILVALAVIAIAMAASDTTPAVIRVISWIVILASGALILRAVARLIAQAPAGLMVIVGLAVIAFPVAASDMSPAVIQIISLIAFLAFGALIFGAVSAGRLRTRRPTSAVPTLSHAWMWSHRTFKETRLIFAQARPVVLLAALMIALFGGLAWLGVVSAMRSIEDAQDRYAEAPSFLHTPLERVISWHDLSRPIEVDAETGAQRVGVAYMELGLQVWKSRDAAAKAACGPRPTGKDDSSTEESTNSPANASTSSSESQGGAPPQDFWDRLKSKLATARSVFDAATCGAVSTLPRAGTGDASNVDRDSEDAESNVDRDSLDAAFQVPAVHDDFAATYLIAAFGVDIAVLAVGLQAALVLVSCSIGAALLTRTAPVPWDRDLRWFAGYLMLGMAGLLATHFALSWGNIYGAFPVMGQPMTFLSAGSSHIIAVVGGFVVFMDVALRLTETPPVARRISFAA